MSTTQFFKREESRIHDLSETQLREAFVLYENKVTNELIQEVEEEYGVSFEEESVRKLLGVFISKALGRGMEITHNTHVVTDFYKEQKNIETDTRCGVLDKSTRSFYPCATAEHWKTLLDILKQDYPDKYEALEEMSYGVEPKEEYKGIQKKTLDQFIMDNFELLGGVNVIESYL